MGTQEGLRETAGGSGSPFLESWLLRFWKLWVSAVRGNEMGRNVGTLLGGRDSDG